MNVFLQSTYSNDTFRDQISHMFRKMYQIEEFGGAGNFGIFKLKVNIVSIHQLF